MKQVPTLGDSQKSAIFQYYTKFRSEKMRRQIILFSVESISRVPQRIQWGGEDLKIFCSHGIGIPMSWHLRHRTITQEFLCRGSEIWYALRHRKVGNDHSIGKFRNKFEFYRKTISKVFSRIFFNGNGNILANYICPFYF